MMRMNKVWMAVLVLVAAAGASGQAPPAGYTVDKDKKEVHIPCKVAQRKLPNLPEIYPIEVVATHPPPKGQKAHETVVVFDAKPSDIHKALESLGLKAGKPVRGEDGVASGAELDVLIEFTDKAGAKKRLGMEAVLADRKTARSFPPLKWYFTGSSMKQVDPNKPDLTYSADLTGTLIGIYPVTDELVIQTNLTMKEEGAIKIEVAPGVLPPEGKDALLILRPAQPKPAVPAAAVSFRAAAESEGVKLGHRLTLPAAKAGSAPLPPFPSTSIADPYGYRKDLSAERPAASEARPAALPLPPVPAAK